MRDAFHKPAVNLGIPEHVKYCVNCGTQMSKDVPMCPKCQTRQPFETPASAARIHFRTIIRGKLAPLHDLDPAVVLKDYPHACFGVAEDERLLSVINLSDPYFVGPFARPGDGTGYTGIKTIDVWNNAALTATNKKIRYTYMIHLTSPFGRRNASQFASDFDLEDGEEVIDELTEVIAEIRTLTQTYYGRRYAVSGLRERILLLLQTNNRLLTLNLGQEGDFQCLPTPIDVGEKVLLKAGDIFRHGLFILTEKRVVYLNFRDRNNNQYNPTRSLESIALNPDDNVSVSLAPRTGIFSGMRSPYEMVITRTNGRTKTIKVGIREEDMPFARAVQALLSG